MSGVFKAACVQVNASADLEDNIAQASRLIVDAAGAGAKLVLTPENTTMIVRGREATLAKAHPEASHPAIRAFAALAAKLGVWLSIGSLTIRLSEEAAANRSYLFAPDGSLAARYDKIHMFDVNVPDGQVYRESATFERGVDVPIVPLPWGKLGLTICYDLRFPQLYRALAQAGADFLTVPSAFTRVTGRAHWHTLLRARAVETGCYVFAAAQCGDHDGGRETYGHSLIIGPWGEVLAEADEAPGIILADIEPARVAEARAMVPAWQLDAPTEEVSQAR